MMGMRRSRPSAAACLGMDTESDDDDIAQRRKRSRKSTNGIQHQQQFAALMDAPDSQESIRFHQRSQTSKSKDKYGPIHYGYRCDSCGAEPIIGARYHCEECPAETGEVDLCDICVSVVPPFETQVHRATHMLCRVDVVVEDFQVDVEMPAPLDMPAPQLEVPSVEMALFEGNAEPPIQMNVMADSGSDLNDILSFLVDPTEVI
mmetsp:Transcript_43587/g.70758  ORF Transcript_43587/g.70758 Transcript_43587/m.70758 type:complete len:204 (+) Transcript_43587:328-939(+)